MKAVGRVAVAAAVVVERGVAAEVAAVAATAAAVVVAAATTQQVPEGHNPAGLAAPAAPVRAAATHALNS